MVLCCFLQNKKNVDLKFNLQKMQQKVTAAVNPPPSQTALLKLSSSVLILHRKIEKNGVIPKPCEGDRYQKETFFGL